MREPATNIEAARAIIHAMNAMSSRYNIASADEWDSSNMATEDLFGVLETLGFPEELIETNDDGSFVLVVRLY